MAFWDKLSETVSSKSKEVADKAKEIAEVTSLTSKISTQESLIEKYYKEIGRFVYEHKDEQCDNGLEERFKLVDAAYEEIEKLKKDIRNIKGIKLCDSCGAEVASDAAFCPKCGTAVPEEIPQEVQAEEVREVPAEDAAAAEAVPQNVEEAPVAETPGEEAVEEKAE